MGEALAPSMNLILFDRPFERVRLDGADPRARHIRDVLRAGPGALVYLGFLDGPRARARVEVLDGGALELEVVATEPPPPPLPLTLLVGLPRPHTARRILSEAASLGLEALHCFPAEKSQPSYARIRLWQGREWRDRLRLGAEQGFTTRLPQVAHHPDLAAAFDALPPWRPRVALDNYEAEVSLAEALPPQADGAVLALGPEGGWTAQERDAFRRSGWRLAHLGPHVLRVETACVAAVAAAAGRLGLWRAPTGSGEIQGA
jgi:RsmE family RNA methyltransferase